MTDAQFLEFVHKELQQVSKYLYDCDFVMADNHLDWVNSKIDDYLNKDSETTED